jgi:hypothetical protein
VKAVVVDVGWVNGLAAIRSLRRAGIPVFAVDDRAGPLGFRSRYIPLIARDDLEPGLVNAARVVRGVFR